MKPVFKLFTLLLLAALPLTLFSQSQTVVVEYMKVTQESEGTYLQVEKAWKQIHQKRIEEGTCNGWQLWRNVYAGYGDPYQYMVVTWYTDWAHSLQGDPDGFFDQFMDSPDSEILGKTQESRVLVSRDVSHSVASAENNEGGKYIVLNRMKTKPGKWGDYIESEQEIFKPLFEEAIRRGQRASWGLWQSWPYDEGQIRLVTVDGYKSIEQMTGEGEDLLPVVHPELTWDEIQQKGWELRDQASIELYELVDAVFPAAEEEEE